MPLITFGDATKLRLKIPSKGDTNWAEDFKTYFVDPIVEHDHSGANGKGKQLTEASLADNAIIARHVNFNLDAINNVSPTPPSTNQYLKFTGTQWAPAAIDETVVELNNGDVSGTGGIGTDASGVGLGANAEVHISNIQNTDLMDFSSRNATTTPANTMVGIKFVIDSATVANKTVKFNNLRDCIIISNVDIEVAGTIDKCIIIMENNDATTGDELCTLKLTSATESTPIVNASKILTDVIEVSAGTTASKNLFSDSEIKVKDLKLELALHAGAIDNSITITRSNVDIADQLSNSIDLSSQSAVVLTLDNSKVSLASLSNIPINNTIVSVDANSELKQIASNYVKVWAGTRWNYLVSPSGTGKIIVSNNDEPSERDFTLGNVNNVNTTGQSANKILRYNGNDWVVGPTITGSGTLNLVNTINTSGGGITISSTPSGTDQVLKWNGSAFVPTTLDDAVQFVERTVTITYNLNKSSGYTNNPHYHTFGHSLTDCGLASHLSAAGISTSNITEIKLVGNSTYSHTNGLSELYIKKGDATWLACVKNGYTISNYTSLEQDGTVSGTIDTSLLLSSIVGTPITYTSASSTDNRSGTFCSTSQEKVVWSSFMSADPLGDVRLVASELFMNDGSATYVVKFKISAMTGPITTSSGSVTKNTGN